MHWCGLYVAGHKRFAWVRHRKVKPGIQVWCLGDGQAFTQFGPALRYRTRESPDAVGWSEDFQGSFEVETESDLRAAADALHQVSYRISMKG